MKPCKLRLIHKRIHIWECFECGTELSTEDIRVFYESQMTHIKNWSHTKFSLHESDKIEAALVEKEEKE